MSILSLFSSTALGVRLFNSKIKIQSGSRGSVLEEDYHFLVYVSGGEAFGCETGGRSEGLDPLSARTEGWSHRQFHGHRWTQTAGPQTWWRPSHQGRSALYCSVRLGHLSSFTTVSAVHAQSEWAEDTWLISCCFFFLFMQCLFFFFMQCLLGYQVGVNQKRKKSSAQIKNVHET